MATAKRTANAKKPPRPNSTRNRFRVKPSAKTELTTRGARQSTADAPRRGSKVTPKESTEAKGSINARKDKRTTRRAGGADPAGDFFRAGSKGAAILELLKREGGATIAALVGATGWQAHSVRGFLSGSVKKKLGLDLTNTKSADGERHYRIAF